MPCINLIYPLRLRNSSIHFLLKLYPINLIKFILVFLYSYLKYIKFQFYFFCTLQRQIIIRKILTVFISCLTLILSLESVQPLLQNANDYYWLLFKKHHRLFMLLISIYILVWSKEHTHTHTHTNIKAI